MLKVILLWTWRSQLLKKPEKSPERHLPAENSKKPLSASVHKHSNQMFIFEKNHKWSAILELVRCNHNVFYAK